VPRKKRQHTAEFKQAAVELVLGRDLSIAQAAGDLDVGQSLLGRPGWAKLGPLRLNHQQTVRRLLTV
jgi:transposase-like protein